MECTLVDAQRKDGGFVLTLEGPTRLSVFNADKKAAMEAQQQFGNCSLKKKGLPYILDLTNNQPVETGEGLAKVSAATDPKTGVLDPKLYVWRVEYVYWPSSIPTPV